jgi:hypothetical protein
MELSNCSKNLRFFARKRWRGKEKATRAIEFNWQSELDLEVLVDRSKVLLRIIVDADGLG